MKTGSLARLALASLGACAGVAAHSADLVLHVDAREVMRKHVHTDMTLAVRPGSMTLVFPKWIPGEHSPSGPLDSIIGLTIRAGGATLPWHRQPLDMYALNLEVPAGVTQLEISLDTGLAVEGGEFSTGPTSSAQLAILPWNEFVLFPKGRDADMLSTEVSVQLPAEWQASCALALTPQGADTLRLEGATLARLIDSPLQMGRYLTRIPLSGSAPFPELAHTLSISADSAQALTLPPDFAAGYSRLVAQAGTLFGTRMYRHYTWLLSLSDHVAHFGLEHHESSDDRAAEDELSDAPHREALAELLAHEYVHSWNGKYRRPAGLLSPDYQKPMDGSLLWVYEGMTQFWGTALPVRAGLIPPESYRDYLAAEAGTFEVETGDRWRPMGDTAVAAQVLYSSPDSWELSRRSVDYYEASIFLWLNVDAQLRSRSHGQASLDDFVHRFYAGAGGAPGLKPYVEADVYATLAQVAPGDWRELIHRHLDGTGAQMLLEGLKSTGWQLQYSAEPNSYIESEQKRRKQTVRIWSIGLSISEDKDKGQIIDTVEDRAAARAGAGPSMKIVAVNGRAYSADVLDAAIAAAQGNHRPIELLVESGDYYRTLPVAYFDGPRFPHLVRSEGAPDTLAELLKAR